MMKIWKTLAFGIAMAITTVPTIAFAEEGDIPKIEIVEEGNVENINADEKRPYLVDIESGTVYYYDLDDFRISRPVTRSNDGLQTITYTGDVVLPRSSANASDDKLDPVSLSVRVKLTLKYETSKINGFDAYRAVSGTCSYTRTSTAFSVNGGTMGIYTIGAGASGRGNNESFTGYGGSIKAKNQSVYVASNDPSGQVGVRATAKLRHGQGAMWEFKFSLEKVSNSLTWD